MFGLKGYLNKCLLAMCMLCLACSASLAQVETCVVDQQGAEDQPGQKDVNQFCRSVTGASCTGERISANFDDKSWSGNNTGDGCVLFDSDGDGMANSAVCFTWSGTVPALSATTCYSCNDSHQSRCYGSVPTSCGGSSCSGNTSAADPFSGTHKTGNVCSGTNCKATDAQATCCITAAGNFGTPIDFCSYPSAQPNSNASDCIIFTPNQCNTDADCPNDDLACTDNKCVSGSCTHPATAAGTECRASAGACDVAETCNGTSPTCPTDVFVSSTTTCRAQAGVCDIAESCTGSSAACPADGVQGNGTSCSDGNSCTVNDFCNGIGTACISGDAVTCTALDECHVAGVCNTSTGVCSNPPASAGTTCGSSDATACNAPDTCDASGNCVDRKDTAGTVCQAADGTCDPADVCDGTNNACAAVYANAGVSCGNSADTACNNPDTCNGSGACQNNYEPATTICRAEAGACDVAEYCDGSGGCPANAFEPNGTSCNADQNACTGPDTCQSGICTAGAPVVVPD